MYSAQGDIHVFYTVQAEKLPNGGKHPSTHAQTAKIKTYTHLWL